MEDKTIIPAHEHPENVARAEAILGYEFSDKALLEAALTHPSALDKETMLHNYERLEFLGDSILGAITANYLFNTYKDLDEGGLTRVKVSLVSGTTLSRVAHEEGIAGCIIFGESETGTDRRGLHSALENVYESIVAALFIDGGIDVTKAWIYRTLLVRADRKLANEPESPKSSLQEFVQARHMSLSYRIVGTDGPPHARTFFAEALVDGAVAGEGSGSSKKRAEASAAAQAFKKLAG